MSAENHTGRCITRPTSPETASAPNGALERLLQKADAPAGGRVVVASSQNATEAKAKPESHAIIKDEKASSVYYVVLLN
jgi:hypothetical protein